MKVIGFQLYARAKKAPDDGYTQYLLVLSIGSISLPETTQSMHACAVIFCIVTS